MRSVKNVPANNRLEIHHGNDTIVTTPAEVWAALKMYRTPKESLLREDTLHDLLLSAIEGGSTYWAGKMRSLEAGGPKGNFIVSCLTHGFTITDRETDETTTVSREAIIDATYLLRDFRYSSGAPAPHFNDAANDNIDSETGDAFLQLCAFKELVYG
jgi:hypothetical protein